MTRKNRRYINKHFSLGRGLKYDQLRMLFVSVQLRNSDYDAPTMTAILRRTTSTILVSSHVAELYPADVIAVPPRIP